MASADSNGTQAWQWRSAWRSGSAMFVLTLAVYVFTAGGSLTTTDAVVTYELTRQIVEHQTVALPGNLLGNDAHRGRDGRFYSPFGPGQSIFNLPFYLSGKALMRLGFRAGREDSLLKAVVALGNTVASAAAVTMFFLLARGVSGSERAAAATALAVGFATPLWPYSKFGFNVPLSALLVTAAVYAAWASVRASRRPGSAWAGFWLGLAVLTRYELGLMLVPLALWFFLESANVRRFLERLASLLLGLAPAIAVCLAYNLVRFGHPLDTGYLRDTVPQFGSSLMAGLYGLLLSPAASLLVYCPLVIGGLAALALLSRRDAALAALVGAVGLSFVVFYALLGNWMGGRSYGPRYLVPFVPVLLLPLASALSSLQSKSRVALGVLGVVSLGVQLPGVLVDYAKVSVSHARREGAPSTEERLADWSVSPLLLNADTAFRAVPANVRWLLGTEAPPRPPAGGHGDFSQGFAFSLDFWWLYLFFMGAISRPIALAVPLVLLAVIVATSLRLRRLVRRPLGTVPDSTPIP